MGCERILYVFNQSVKFVLLFLSNYNIYFLSFRIKCKVSAFVE